jgi:hypothetical protein
MKNGMRKIAREEVGKHERAMHGAKKMRAGGKTNSDMKKYGRNMAKVMNQRSPVRKSSGPR